MKTKLSVLSAAMLAATLTIMPVVSQAAIPQTVEGQSIPSLAPMLERTTPAVVSVAVTGLMFLSKEYLMFSVTFSALMRHKSKCKNVLLEA